MRANGWFSAATFVPAVVIELIVSQANIEAVKEPRGFIKILQIILAICAFATTTSHYSSTGFSYKCNGTNSTESVSGSKTLNFGYPYKLNQVEGFLVPLCDDTALKHTVTYYGDYSSSAEFYVFVGVMAFLYSLAAVILYVFADDKYHQIDTIPIVDFVVTIVFVLLWLISSAAWSDGVSKVKHYTDPTEIWSNENENFPECAIGALATCTPNDLGNYSNLNVSLIFGFLNMLVWGGNVWFLYKETKWFKSTEEIQPQDASSPHSPSSI